MKTDTHKDSITQSVTVYSLPSCPMCQNLKRRLDAAKISYEDCEDVEKMASLGIMNCPMMQINEGPLMSYKESLKWVSEREAN